MFHLALGLGAIGIFFAHYRRHHLAQRGLGCGAGDLESYGGTCGPRGFRGFRRGRHRFGGGRRAALHWVLRELDTTPAQERAIVAELEAFEQRARAAADLVRGARGEVAQALSGDELDEAALAAATSRWDSASDLVREAAAATLRAVHGHLDASQRRKLGELVDRMANRGGRQWGGHFEGPFR